VTARPTVGASVDLGSNSVHLLVAEVDAGHELRALTDESVFLGLGETVDTHGHLGAPARAELCATLAGYANAARARGADHVTFLGTEPIRRAGDAARIVADVEATTGLPLHVLSHEEEAYLTLIGVTAGQPVRDETLVVDIGGGSSEFCAVAEGGTARAAGLRLGSRRLSARFARTDPVDHDALVAMRAAADEILRDALPAAPADLVAVGGTASNLLKVTEAQAMDRILTRERLAEALTNLMGSPAATVAERFVLNPQRAPLLPAGAVIVEALMRRYDVDRVRVSLASLREGAVLVVNHAGRDWRDRLAELAHGWRR
jgi:exopolyphosphatase/guanosine-5'-triphosphate,3'-diphosphate pyrophosphatase